MTTTGGSSSGQTVGGRYELGELLGRGGMAEVRKGTDTRLGRVVAVKRLRTDLASDATFQARFRREAQSSASLNHPAIVSVYDTGEELSSDGSDVAQPYIVMEYVAGRTLREVLSEGRKILPERALELTSGVLSALDYSHRAGIIHRDIKPGNVMLNPSGDVKVMDFGIARAVSDASSTMTQTAAVVGTAQYLSPEQARGETVDSRSDVYSTGCLLYELLTARPPFVGDSPVAVAYQHVREPATPPSSLEDDLDPEIDAIVMKALAKRVEDRYQSAAAMRSDIERYLAGRPVQAPAVAAVAPVDDAPTAAVTTTTATAPPAEERRGSRTPWFVLLALLLIALLGVGAFFLPTLFESEPDQITVPSVIGQNEDTARAELGDLGLRITVTREPDPEIPVDEVIDQDPADGDQVDEGATIALVVSNGPPEVEVPDVVGDDRADARRELREAGLRVRVETVASDEDADEVLSTDPGAGARVQEQQVVTLTVSEGPVAVPTVIGLDEASATAAIEQAGFTVRITPDPGSAEQPTGTVVDQSPDGDTTQPQGTEIVLFVSTFEPTPTEEPSPTDTPSEPDDSTGPGNGNGNGNSNGGGNGNGNGNGDGNSNGGGNGGGNGETGTGVSLPGPRWD
ncbi:Stk1 family PASTA domain-containing Ser/Thr kinase [Nocardioides lentus]|uniref:non-specific serine/threonine protein kinase n=1 Tax=Nocardioides lentus TaxID=338077 RepID=A0ABN2NYI8_9ACTN